MKYFIGYKETDIDTINKFKPILLFASTMYEHYSEGIERYCESLNDGDYPELRKELDDWRRK